MPRCVRLQSSLASANPLCTRISRMLTGCFALTRSLPQKRVTFSISTSPSAISAADLPPERSICICLMCMPAERMDASIPALPCAQLFAHLRLLPIQDLCHIIRHLVIQPITSGYFHVPDDSCVT